MKSHIGKLYILLSTALLLAGAGSAYAQVQIKHQAPTVLESGQTHTFTFSAPGVNPGNVQDAFLFYRMDGDLSYKQEKARLDQTDFVAELSIPENSSGSLEYYFQVDLTDGRTISYPDNRATGGPVRVEVVENQSAEISEGNVQGIEYEVLSPEPGQELAAGEVVVALTLFFDEEEVDTAVTSFKLFFNGEDITQEADASRYFFTYVPDDLPPGSHSVSLQLENEEGTAEIVSWSFRVVDPVMAARQSAEEDNFIPSGQAELTARNQMIAGSNSDVLSGNVRLSGQKNNIRYSAYGLLTTQEDPRLQAQNRYGAELYVGNWLEMKGGHIYPTLSPLTIAGRRVEGINTAFRPFNGAVNLQFVYGRMRRGITNLYQAVQSEPVSFNDTVVDTSYTLNFRDQGFGAFKRDIIGGRLGFGRGRTFNFGFNLLKVQDDTNSIAVVYDYNDLMRKRPELATNLTQEDHNKLQQDPNLLDVNGNPLPKGNFVAGSDLSLNLHKNNIQFRAEGAISLLNEDISDGPLDSETADELGIDLDAGVENTLERLSWIIIINENMSTLPLRFDLSGTESQAEIFFPMGIVGTESELSLNYFKNNLRLKYRWVGPDFNSLANSTVRKDISGLSVTDRFRLLSSRVYVTLGYENLNDNVINHKEATTNTVTYRGNVSWYPVQRELPRISIGIRNRSRDNGIGLSNPYLSGSLEQRAVRNYEIVSGDTLVAPNARKSNSLQLTTSISKEFELFGISHDASLNYSILNTRDEVFAYGGANSTNLSLRVRNRFTELPLDTHVGINMNNTETLGGLTTFKIVGFDIGGRMFLMDEKLNVDAGIAFTRNTAEVTSLRVNENDPAVNGDDFYEADPTDTAVSENNAYILHAGGRYTINENHALLVNLRFTNVTSTLAGTTLPNDRLLQARYIFNF